MNSMRKYVKLNLQLFAELNPNTLTGEGGISNENKIFYDRTLIEEAGPYLVHDQFAQKRNVPKNGGTTINFRKYASLPPVTAPLTEGVTPDGQNLVVTAETAELQQYGRYITITDVLKTSGIDNNLMEATKAIGRQMGVSLDRVTRNVLQTGTNVFYCPKVSSTGAKTVVTDRSEMDATCRLSVDMVKRVVAFLRAMNAPTFGGYYVAIIHPYAAYDLMQDERWEEAHKYTDAESIYKGELGRIAGVRFVESSEAAIYTGSGNDCPSGLAVFGTLFIADGAYGTTEVDGNGAQTIIKQLGSGGTSDPLNQRATVGWKGMKTAKILIQAYLVRVESCGEFSADAEGNW